MKTFSILLLVLLVACKPNTTNLTVDSADVPVTNAPQEEVTDNFPVDSISLEEFRMADSVSVISPFTSVVDDSTRVFPDSLKIVFKLNNGADSVLVNEWEENGDGGTVFHYVQSCKDIDYWLVFISYYEGSEYLLMDKDNGNKIFVWGPPVVSPDKTHFITYSCDIEAGYDYNGIQLFEIKEGKAELKWQKEINTWGPDEVRWKDDNTLYIKKYSIDYSGGNSVQKYTYGTVKVSDLR